MNFGTKFSPKKCFGSKYKKKIVKFHEQVCQEQVFCEWDLRKQSSNSESTPSGTPKYQVSFKIKHFEVSGPSLPIKVFSGWILRKQLLTSKQAPCNTSMYRISFKTKHFLKFYHNNINYRCKLITNYMMK